VVILRKIGTLKINSELGTRLLALKFTLSEGTQALVGSDFSLNLLYSFFFRGFCITRGILISKRRGLSRLEVRVEVSLLITNSREFGSVAVVRILRGSHSRSLDIPIDQIVISLFCQVGLNSKFAVLVDFMIVFSWY
jgi:hypothetical protein